MESNLFCFHLPVLHINLVSTQYNWNILTDPAHRSRSTHEEYIGLQNMTNCKPWFVPLFVPAKITVPCWNILVGQPCCNIKHDDGTLSMYTAAKEHNANQSEPSSKYKLLQQWLPCPQMGSRIFLKGSTAGTNLLVAIT